MHNFSDQCQDLARALLGNNLKHINDDGTITPSSGEESRIDESGHAALAIGEFFRATGEVELGGFDLFDLSARCITHQAFAEEASGAIPPYFPATRRIHFERNCMYGRWRADCMEWSSSARMPSPNVD